MKYRGRFAPTPSGPLHLGSLLTAIASFLEARSRNGAWLLRIDDLDVARCPPGADAQILRQLEQHGLEWDEVPRFQRQCRYAYRDALAALSRQGAVYSCACTRAELKGSTRPGPDGPVYAGACRGRNAALRGALRLQVAAGRSCFDDGWQGTQCRDLDAEVGDFVVRRADGQPSYQLACAVDEHAQRITEVVRGADLLGSTFQQRRVLAALGLPAPTYRHLPVLTDARGRKLSKQNHAPPVQGVKASENLHECLRLLNQDPPENLARCAPAEVLHWAKQHWSAAKVPRGAQLIAYNALQQRPSGAP